MLSGNNNQKVTLQPPGAGLPKFELFMARLLVGWRVRRTSRAEVAAAFESEKLEILKLVRDLEPNAGRKPVLIPRLRGMEDSSRFWSIYMTVDHLRIVNQGIGDLIRTIASGKVPNRAVSTADVKPSTSADVGAVQEFETECNTFQDTVQGIANLETKLTWAHPWFGELDAAGWYFMAGFHMGLHKQQILAIQRRLGS